MTQKIINTGTADTGNGDPIRTAFGKVNDNFTELYAALGLDSNGLNLGAFEFTGSTITTTDSSAVIIDQNVTITNELTMQGDIIPNIAGEHNLGSSTRPWKSLYVSNNTIYIGNTAVGINQSGKLTVGGSSISDSIGKIALGTSKLELTDEAASRLSLYNNNTEKSRIQQNGNDLLLSSLLGGVTLSATDGVGGDWYFNTSGELVSSGGKFLSSPEVNAVFGSKNTPSGNSGVVELRSGTGSVDGGSIYIIAGTGGSGNDGEVAIRTGSGPYEWLFDNGGNLTLPRGSLKHDDALGFLTIEGPVTADMIDAGSPGTYHTISNGVQILTHRPSDDLERKFRFSWDGALYMPTDSSNGQVGAVEWRGGNTTSQVRSTPGGGIFPPGLALVSYSTDGSNAGISFNIDFNKNWIFDKYGNTRIPGDIISEGNINIDINLTDSTLRRWSFGEDGDLNIPGAVRQGNSKLAFNENGGTNVYLTPTTDDSSAVFINTTSVQAYATEAVSIQAGNAAGLGDLELNWANAEVVWIDARDNDAASISPATRPWAGMSSYDAYPVIIAYTAPGGVLPTPSNFPVVANSARQAHIAWQEGLATVEGVSITAGAKGWQFTATGVLELPGAVQLKVYDNTLERDLYIETPVAGMMVMVGTATQVYDGSAWRTLSYAP